MVENTRRHVTVNIDRSVYKLFSDICDSEGIVKSRKIELLLLNYIKEYDKGRE